MEDLFEKAKIAEELMESQGYELIETYVEEGTKAIEKVLSAGLANDYAMDADGNIIGTVKTWQEKYWDYVGEHRALKSLPKYLNKIIEKRDGLIKKRNASGDKHND
jgi:hypothetical protein